VGEGIEEMRLLVEREFKQSELPIFFCGDFNNSPQSPIYSYMRDEIGVRADPRSTRMRSAYDVYGSLQPDQGRILLPAEGNAASPLQEPTHTTVTSRRCWTIDYIWYNPASLRPTHLLEVPEVLSLSLSHADGGGGGDDDVDLGWGRRRRCGRRRGRRGGWSGKTSGG
jgi:endonuclease/exonuclease/phosphatase family metal-dependent hydrolase